MTNFWSIFIIILVVGNILAMVWLLLATSRSNGMNEAETTGHKWDGIEELNNPLPRWWLGLFVLTIIFAGVYLVLYPGLGSYEGTLNWSQMEQFNSAKEVNREQQDEFFAEFADYTVPMLAGNAKAMETGERLFANNCATCHGSDARGAKGFPNLTDSDWLYGGEPETILTSITDGRAGVMPNLRLKGADVTVLALYVQHMAGRKDVTDYAIQRGESLFGVCAACHGPDGKGNQAIGAPNLTDDIWLHGPREADIEHVLRNGIQGNMPSFKNALSENEIKLLTAYVTSLGQRTEVGE
ncbi:Cbb3-type cytochrome c oxidase subunit [Arenicella chitinivorans]|uniref:Cbb3-type cytochrome c oxidase subunit n=1 Tax=Arenicella chitinivorans TaxID=1329800 RepID=A0A918VRB2_9GAMM|nr:cytochrome-c oxidase, cbb3-type subunit III [Arenicella chitinivorans]GHA17455.1 Cbb3-type cytochrome c oxidase subunit [Arenicella chitinivorans]